MTPQELIDLFRKTVADTEQEYLWSDEEVIEYLNDAQRMLCRLTYGIQDGTTEAVTQIDVAAGDIWVDLHASIMKIKAAQRQSDFRRVDVINIEDLQGGMIPSRDDYGAAPPMRLDDTTGELLYLVTGITDGQARLLRIPTTDDTLQLTVERLPLTTISIDDDLDSATALEVRSEHHRHLVWWMAHLAYLKQDAETIDTKRAEEFEARFRAYCERARMEKERRDYKPRTVAYGGY